MSKKDFELIAEIVASIASPHIRRDVHDRFARALSHGNPRFDAKVFRKACNV